MKPVGQRGGGRSSNMKAGSVSVPTSGSHSVDVFDRKWQSADRVQTKFFRQGIPVTQTEVIFRETYGIVRDLLSSHGLLHPDARLLEVGCGRGTMSLYLCANDDARPYCLDLLHSSVSLTRSNFEEEGREARVVQGNGLRLPFNEGTFDAIYTIGLLEHFEDVGPPVGEMVRVLRPGGLFITLNIPAKSHPASWLSRVYKLGVLVTKRLRTNPFVRPSRALGFLKTAATGQVKTSWVWRNDYPPEVYAAALRGAGIPDVAHCGVNPFPIFSPVSHGANAALSRAFRAYLAVGRALGCANPFVTGMRMGRSHFMWGVKPGES
jgi:SAM-dependent methyltransferase